MSKLTTVLPIDHASRMVGSGIKSIKTLRAVAASGITVALAIVADIRPEFAVLFGALIAPLAKAIDPSSGKEADYGVNAK